MRKKRRTKYHNPPLVFDYALIKYVPDVLKIKNMKNKLKGSKTKGLKN